VTDSPPHSLSLVMLFHIPRDMPFVLQVPHRSTGSEVTPRVRTHQDPKLESRPGRPGTDTLFYGLRTLSQILLVTSFCFAGFRVLQYSMSDLSGKCPMGARRECC